MPASLIIVIGWLYVATLAAFTEPSIVGGILTFLFAGALPCGLILYFATSRVRRERRKFQELQAARQQAAAAEAVAAETSEKPEQ